MNEKQFKDAFIVTFMATWCCNNYNDCCVQNKHEILNNPPVEDAIYLAQKNWEKYIEFAKDV